MKKEIEQATSSIPMDEVSSTEEYTNNENSLFDVNREINIEDRFVEKIDLNIEKDNIYNNEITFGNLINNKETRKIGNLYTFFYLKDGNPLIVIGPHWPFYICLSTTITIICLSYFYIFWNLLGYVYITVGVLIYLGQIFSYSYTFMKNPGLPKNIRQIKSFPNKLEKNYKFCSQCQIIINLYDNASHCDDCNVCIIGKKFLKL